MDCGAVKEKKFRNEWLDFEDIKSCITEDPQDPTKFLCEICKDKSGKNRSFRAIDLARVRAHLESKSHQENRNKEFAEDESDNNASESNKTPRKQKFLAKWLEKVQFKDWLRPVLGNEFMFRCVACDNDFSCAAGMSNISRHASTPDHINSCAEKEILIIDDLTASLQDELPTSFDRRKKAAEIRLAALAVNCNVSYRAVGRFLDFFQETGKDQGVLQAMTLGETKCSQIVSKVLGPAERMRIIEVLKHTKFSIYVDEATISKTNWKYMPILVRYVDPSELSMKVELLELYQVDARDCSAKTLFADYKKRLVNDFGLSLSNIIGLSCDNAPVMMGDKGSFKTHLLKENKNVIVLGCPRHKSALIAEDACAFLPEYVEVLVADCISFVRGSPKRESMFMDLVRRFGEDELKLIRYCTTRWLTRSQSISRLRKLWNCLVDFIREVYVKEKKPKMHDMLESMEHPATVCYLAFLGYVLNFYNMFNAYLQGRETRVHLLHKQSLMFVTKISGHFIKRSLMGSINMNFDFVNINNQRPLDEINLGPDCNDLIENMPNQSDDYKDIILDVRTRCLKFYIATVTGIVKILNFSNDFYASLHVLEATPAIFDSDRDGSLEDILVIARKFGIEDTRALKIGWREVYNQFKDEAHLDLLSFDQMWQKILSFRDKEGNLKYNALRELVNLFQTLPHSNAEAERVFSMLPDIVTKKRRRLTEPSISSSCVTKWALRSNGETAKSMTVTEDHLSLMNSENLYAPSTSTQSSNITLYAADE